MTAGPWDGAFLFRDFVTVPDPVLGANTLGGDGAPRAVPLDAVVAALSSVLSAGLVARLLLVAPLLLVGAGMTVLLRHHGPVATAVGAGLAIANPAVAERLLLGQAPSLLGYAMIPWLVVAVRSRGPLEWRVLLVLAAAVPAALTPVGAVMAGVTVVVTVLWFRPPALGRRVLEATALLAPVALLSLPWLVLGLADPTAGAVPEGADAFAVRSDGWFGTIGSVITLGGIWAEGAWPDSRTNLLVVGAQLVLVLAAITAWVLLHTLPIIRGTADDPRWPDRRALDLAAAGYAAVVVTVLLLAGPLLPVWRVLQQVPGVALARDTHRWLGWSALAVAALVALGTAHLVRVIGTRIRDGAVHNRVGRAAYVGIATGACLAVLSLGVLTVPDVPGRLAKDLRPVAMPPEWDIVVDQLNTRDGRVLVVPWQPFRQVDWVGPVQFLDPFPRALVHEVVHARDLTVRRDDTEWRVGGEDPAIPGLAEGVLDPDALREAEITRVVIWRGSPGAVTVLDELEVVHEGEEWIVLAVSATAG
ncbi:hypothetical protein MWU75_08835 [Ornithinimicrobium sp. F0845]|uniref:hypothetical protein n=1 Tax=Ornithinimicrobium sp. F0845 TaxID=2926412 RepID=UPI001FF6D3E3|nr:hypothetical protein [Ornithinimicrobium sp. F0845]MCK0112240.1 hypothetical protein [Ornithinimicrobium sp. F0845]